MGEKQLIILRGLPGSGKTTFAGHLSQSMNCPMYAADDHMVDDDGNYSFDPKRLHWCHKKCQSDVERAMKFGAHNIIVHNTNTTEKELKPYLDLASMYGYNVVSLIVENRHGNSSVHGVPEHSMERMRNRFSVKL